MGKIRYHSFDFDGCLSNEEYCELLDATRQDTNQTWITQASAEQANQALLKANEAFLNGVRSSRGDSKDYVIVGSNRQDVIMDFGNGSPSQTPSGSVLPRIQAVANSLNATLDKFLLADIENDNKPGTEFDAIVGSDLLHANGSYKPDVRWSKLVDDARFNKVLDDSSKVSLLFAQMQKASMEHPKDEIEFNFYDDRKDITEGLKTFFQENPELIPKNVVLNLHAYSGPQPENTTKIQRNSDIYPYGPPQDIASIQGKGSIPKVTSDWSNFYKQMRAVVISALKDEASHINIAQEFKAEKLLTQYKTDGIAINEIPPVAKEHLAEHLRKMSFADRQKLTSGSLEQQIVAESVGHKKAIGRQHTFTVSADSTTNIKERFQQLKGDHLKRELLLDFKGKIENISSLDDLKKLEKETIKDQSEEYKILATGQGRATRILHLETDSVKALKGMIAEKREALTADLNANKRAEMK